jgi:mono/diheme cytochrome c family protein
MSKKTAIFFAILALALVLASLGPSRAGTQGDPQKGARTYAEQCANCHGEQGGGGYGPSHVGCALCDSFEDLRAKIENDMPRGDPGACTGRCAENTAAYIYYTLNDNG